MYEKIQALDVLRYAVALDMLGNAYVPRISCRYALPLPMGIEIGWQVRAGNQVLDRQIGGREGKK